MKNTILAISPELPYPPTKGSWVDIWGQLLFFHQEGWQIVLAVCGQPPEMAKASNDLPIDIDVHFFPVKVFVGLSLKTLKLFWECKN